MPRGRPSRNGEKGDRSESHRRATTRRHSSDISVPETDDDDDDDGKCPP